MEAKTHTYFPIILLTFVNVIGFTLLIPILPAVVQQYVPAPLVGAVYGGLLSTYALFQFLGAPILGSLSDKYGRRPILFLSQFGTAISWIIFGAAYFVPEDAKILGIAAPIMVIAFSRIIDGITGGNVSVAHAWVSDMTTKENKTSAFGMMGATFGVGFLFGPTIGGLSAATSIGYLGTALVAFLISLTTLAIIWQYLPESLPVEKRDHTLEVNMWRELNILNKIKPFNHDVFVRSLLVIRVFFSLVFASYATIIILLLESQFSLSEADLGLTLSLIGAFAIFNQTVLIRWVAKRIGDLQTLYLSLLVIFIGLMLIPLIPSGVLVGRLNMSFLLYMANAFILNLGISLGMPTFKALLTNHVDETKQGMITGLDEALIALGNAISPVIAGIAYSTIGSGTFVMFAVILLLPTLFIWIKEGNLAKYEPHFYHEKRD